MLKKIRMTLQEFHDGLMDEPHFTQMARNTLLSLTSPRPDVCIADSFNVWFPRVIYFDKPGTARQDSRLELITGLMKVEGLEACTVFA